MEGTTATTPTKLRREKKVFENLLKGACNDEAKKQVTNEFLKSAIGKSVSKATSHGCRASVDTICKTELGKKIVSRTSTGLAGKAVYGAASRSVMANAMKTNTIAAGVGLACTSAKDLYDYATGKKTGRELTKSIGKNAAEASGGLAGSGIGAIIGSCICPGPGTALGSFLGGLIGSMATSKLF